LGSRLDGHIVQGHVDTVATCIAINDTDGKRLYKFQFSPAFSALIIEKGSICVNGVSLTAFNVALDTFDVTIIPYTYDHTTFKSLNVGDHVNIEFDILGKYLLRHQTVSLANESRH
jgi:riboflavin synthase